LADLGGTKDHHEEWPQGRDLQKSSCHVKPVKLMKNEPFGKTSARIMTS
jgi:hypothetical protein